jgi:hypothetical protein
LSKYIIIAVTFLFLSCSTDDKVEEHEIPANVSGFLRDEYRDFAYQNQWVILANYKMARSSNSSLFNPNLFERKFLVDSTTTDSTGFYRMKYNVDNTALRYVVYPKIADQRSRYQYTISANTGVLTSSFDHVRDFNLFLPVVLKMDVTTTGITKMIQVRSILPEGGINGYGVRSFDPSDVSQTVFLDVRPDTDLELQFKTYTSDSEPVKRFISVSTRAQDTLPLTIQLDIADFN